MNTEIHWGRVGVVLVAVAGIAGIFFMLGKKSDDVGVVTAPQTAVKTNVKTQETKPVEPKKDSAVEELKAAVYLAAYHDNSMKEEKVGEWWSRKVDVTAIDVSQKAAYGKWWAQDAWSWIAYQSEDGKWIVSAPGDASFDCSVMKAIAKYDSFFSANAESETYLYSKKQCGIR